MFLKPISDKSLKYIRNSLIVVIVLLLIYVFLKSDMVSLLIAILITVALRINGILEERRDDCDFGTESFGVNTTKDDPQSGDHDKIIRLDKFINKKPKGE